MLTERSERRANMALADFMTEKTIEVSNFLFTFVIWNFYGWNDVKLLVFIEEN